MGESVSRTKAESSKLYGKYPSMAIGKVSLRKINFLHISNVIWVVVLFVMRHHFQVDDQ